ncbi:IS66 family insertion sequence element accessory protein TnpA [Vibrio fujianensis]|uniref:IS66 family insertion sequence element accessory protein TnpA n=1 Tax=Vibrio fujianensis TaxID=1974215 RepID=UPI000C16FAC4|nr:hypothetical protein [Vibrio fujianensis]
MNQSNKTQFWAEIIEQQSMSELSIVAFCKANQLTVNTFYYWRKKLYGGRTATSGVSYPDRR